MQEESVLRDSLFVNDNIWRSNIIMRRLVPQVSDDIIVEVLSASGSSMNRSQETAVRARLLLLGNRPFLPLAEPVAEQIKMRPHNDGILDELLHAIHQSISVGAWFQSAASIHIVRVRKVRPGLRNRALVRNREHPHPAAQDAQRVHRVEGLRTAIHLSDGQRPALGGPHRPSREGNPVDLVLENGGLAARVC